MTTDERDAFAERHAGRMPKVLLNRATRNGPIGPHGQPKPMTEQRAELILDLVGRSGIAGTPGRTYLIDLIRWKAEYESCEPAPPTGLRGPELAFIRDRAVELVDAEQARVA